MSDPDLPQLHAAKAHSDKKEYNRKHQVLAMMMKRNPAAFVIDSDDGKGIVGITHVNTGYRLHMPRQVIPVPLEKQATGLLRKLKGMNPDKLMAHATGAQDKLLGYLGKNPKAEEMLRKALSYNLVDPRNANRNTGVMAGLGAIPGALGGTIPGEDVSAKKVIGGGLAGAAAGAVAGRYGPRGIQKGLGRILTNVMNPVSYEAGSHGYLKNQKIGDMVRAVVDNKPMHGKDVGRSALFRDYFGMKRPAAGADYFKTTSVGPDGRKLLELNKGHKGAGKLVQEVDQAVQDSIYTSTKDVARKARAGERTLLNAGPMGNFHVNPDGKWSDTWDFALHPGERINSSKNLLRALITPFGQPSTVAGQAMSQREAIGALMNPRRFKHIDKSFLDPLVGQVSKQYGMDAGEVAALLRRAGSSTGRGNNATIRQAVLDAMEGKQHSLDSRMLQRFWRPAEVA